VDAVREAFADPQIQRWHVRILSDEAEALEWITGWARRWAAETDASWAIADSGDRVLGQAGLRWVDLFEAEGHLSYWVRPEARGRGVAVAAAQAVVAWSFDELGLHRLELRHSTANAASCRVAAKLDFPLEGTRREAGRHADGWHDMHLHARLRPRSYAAVAYEVERRTTG
jgi:[ribosomal protein S5]-alanine N-acetyltransferase